MPRTRYGKVPTALVDNLSVCRIQFNSAQDILRERIINIHVSFLSKFRVYNIIRVYEDDGVNHALIASLPLITNTRRRYFKEGTGEGCINIGASL